MHWPCIRRHRDEREHHENLGQSFGTGEKPHMTISREVELTGRVAMLDAETRMAVVAGKNGDISMEVAPDVDISTINVGDTVQATYLEMISITVNAPTK